MVGKQFGKESVRHGVARFFLYHASKSHFSVNEHSHAIRDFLAFSWEQEEPAYRRMAFAMLRDYVYLVCASKMARCFEVNGVTKQRNLQYWLSMKPDNPVFVAQLEGAPGLCGHYFPSDHLSSSQVKIVSRIIKTYTKSRPGDKDPTTSCVHEQVKHHPFYDLKEGRNRFQYLLAVAHENALHHVTHLRDVIGKIMTARVDSQDTSIEAMKVEEESYLDILLDALDQATVWGELWTDFLDEFQDLLHRHLIWLQELISLTGITQPIEKDHFQLSRSDTVQNDIEQDDDVQTDDVQDGLGENDHDQNALTRSMMTKRRMAILVFGMIVLLHTSTIRLNTHAASNSFSLLRPRLPTRNVPLQGIKHTTPT